MALVCQTRHGWRHARERYLRRHPNCVDCEQAGRVTPADTVHHIVDRRDGGADFDERNLRNVWVRGSRVYKGILGAGKIEILA